MAGTVYSSFFFFFRATTPRLNEHDRLGDGKRHSIVSGIVHFSGVGLSVATPVVLGDIGGNGDVRKVKRKGYELQPTF